MPMTRRLPVSAAALGLAACWALPALAADDPVGKETTPGNAQAETPGERAPVLRPGDDGREQTGIFSFVLENDLFYNTDQPYTYGIRSEEHTSEIKSLMRPSSAHYSL